MTLQSVAPTFPEPEDKKAWDNPNLNLENLDLLIAHMEAMPAAAFDMSSWIRGHASTARFVVEAQQNARGKHACGTTACIAGEAALLKRAMESEHNRAHGGDGVRYEAKYWLGLEDDRELFIPGSDVTGVHMEGITRDRAVRVLKYLRATGTVEWNADKRRRRPAPAYTSTMEGKPLPFVKTA